MRRVASRVRPLLALPLVVLLGLAGSTGCGSRAPIARSRGSSATSALLAGSLLPPAPPVLAAPLGDAPLPSRPGLARALAPVLRDPGFGPRVAAVVADPATGSVVLDRRGAVPVPTASTVKIVTAVAALTVLGPHAFLASRVVRPARNLVVLVGGGDPTLASPDADPGYPRPARLAALASAAASAIGRGASVRVGYDASRWAGPATAAGWRPSYVGNGNVAPIRALALDAGRAQPDKDPRVADPPRVAAGRFATLLAAAGVHVVGTPRPMRAAPAAPEVARVASPPLAALVERMLTTSDNDLAEALGREVALRLGEPATFAGAGRALSRALQSLQLPTTGLVLADASGLSRLDRLPPRLLTALLALATRPDRPELRPAIAGLPVAGFTGTLADRFGEAHAGSGAGVVRAKTGSLTGVSSLAGVTVDRDGRLLAFAFVADAVPAKRADAAVAALDRAAAAVASCGCR